MADKKEDDGKKEYVLKHDFSVGTDKNGKPKKTYKKGDTVKLNADDADYLKSKNVIR